MPTADALDAVISFGPLDDLATWLARANASRPARLVATSSMSAESKRHSRVSSDRQLSQRLRDGEERLIEQCERRDIRWTILRPTLIYGAGLDKSLTPIAKRAARYRLFPLPVAPGLRQPVHADDVALAAMRALAANAAVGRILALGGGERLSAGEMFARVRRSIPASTLPVPLPAGLLKLAAHLQPRIRGPLQRLEADLVADNREVEQLLGLQPRAFQPTAATWGWSA